MERSILIDFIRLLYQRKVHYLEPSYQQKTPPKQGFLIPKHFKNLLAVRYCQQNSR